MGLRGEDGVYIHLIFVVTDKIGRSVCTVAESEEEKEEKKEVEDNKEETGLF